MYATCSCIIYNMSDSKFFIRADKRISRFWDKVEKKSNNECWPWKACTNGCGYGQFRGGDTKDKYGSRKWVLAHRFSYILLLGDIPAGLEVDHKCRNRLCVNPLHLEPVTHKKNTLRGNSPSAQQARRSSCIRRHLFDKLEKNSNRRRCSICDRAKEQHRYIKRYGRIPRSYKTVTGAI